MEKSEIKDKAIEAIAVDRFSIDKSSYINFAFFLIDNKVESENIYILAGLENSPHYEQKRYFDIVLNELSIEIDSDEKIDLHYAKYIAQQVVDRKIRPVIGVHILDKLCIDTDYHTFYIEFMELSDALELLDSDHCFIDGLNKDNYEDFCTRTCELFLEIHQKEVPEDLLGKSICNKCSSLVIPKIKKYKRSIFSRTEYQKFICPKCNSDNLYSMRTNKGKEIYLEFEKDYS